MALLKEGSRYIFFNYLSVFLNTIRGIILLTVLNPVSLGIYRLIFTYSSYFRYYNLGFNALAFYRAPPRKLEVLYAQLLQRVNTVLAFLFGILFTIAFVILSWNTLEEQALLISLLLFFILYFTQIGETFITIAKIKGRFDIINIYNVIMSAGSLVLMYGLGFYFGLMGVISGLAVATVISSSYIWVVLRPPKKIRINLTVRRIKMYFRAGVLNILPGMLSVLFSTIEVWLINSKFGVRETGYYSVVMTLVNLILLINTDSLVFLYSKRSKKIQREPWYVLRMTIVSFLLLSVCCIVSIYIIAWGIREFFPTYEPAANIYKLCFWGIPFLVMKNLLVHYLSNNKTTRISVLLMLLLIVKVIVLQSIMKAETFYYATASMNVIFGISIIALFTYDNKLKKA